MFTSKANAALRALLLFLVTCFTAQAEEKITLDQLKRGAEEGNALLQTTLALHYQGISSLSASLESVPTNSTEASKWFLRAARQGQPLAQFNIGTAYLSGRGVLRDGTQAYKWLTLAAKSDNTNVAVGAIEVLAKYETNLTQEQISDGKKLADGFVTSKEAVASSRPPLLKSGSTPVVMTLASLSTNLPVQLVQSTNDFARITIHSDIKVTSVLGFNERNETIIQGSGNVAYSIETTGFLSGRSGGGLHGMAGEPGTKLNIAPLAAHKQTLPFLGRQWEPLDESESIILVTPKVLQIYHVKVGDQAANNSAPKPAPSPIPGATNLLEAIAKAAHTTTNQLRSNSDPFDLDPVAKGLKEAGKRLFLEENRPQEGIEKIEAAIKIDPRMPDAYNLLFSWYALARKDPESAVRILENGIRACPKSGGVHYDLANAYSAMKRSADAISYFKKALELGIESRASAFYNLGNECRNLNRLPEALDNWRKALAEDEKHLNARRNLVIGYFESGDISSASNEANRLIKLDPNGEAGTFAREALKQMK